MLRTGMRPIVCFVAVTTNPVFRCVANRKLEIRRERRGVERERFTRKPDTLKEGRPKSSGLKTRVTFTSGREKERSKETEIWRGEVRKFSRGAMAKLHPEPHFIIRVKRPWLWTFEEEAKDAEEVKEKFKTEGLRG